MRDLSRCGAGGASRPSVVPPLHPRRDKSRGYDDVSASLHTTISYTQQYYAISGWLLLLFYQFMACAGIKIETIDAPEISNALESLFIEGALPIECMQYNPF